MKKIIRTVSVFYDLENSGDSIEEKFQFTQYTDGWVLVAEYQEDYINTNLYIAKEDSFEYLKSLFSYYAID